MSKIEKWQSLRPLTLRMRFYDGFLKIKSFLKSKKICMEKVVLEQDLFLKQHFTKMSSNFSENSNCSINLLFNARGFKLGHFGICDMLFHFWHFL